jgi:hypothetical protein
MPVFRVQVNYILGVIGKWSNVWHIDAANMAAAAAAPVIGMEDHLLALLTTSATLKSYLISEEGTDAFVTIDRNSPGTNGDIGSLLPLWNSVKVLFPTPGFGRPDLKYFKGCVGENTQTNGQLESGIIALFDTEVEAMIDDMTTNSTPLCDESGLAWGSASVQPAVQMRQMHRKRRKAAPTP